MKTVALDVHTGRTQISVSSPDGHILLEKIVETKADCLRREIGAIQGPKRVVFENGHLSGMIFDAIQGVAEEIISCDPTQNALVARADDSNDRQDARRLGTLARANALSPVFVPPEPFRSLRALTCYETRLTRLWCENKSRIKALCRRHSVPYRGKSVF
ncbi:MAG: transposase, partial [Planctomycetes bacterium]|nr:transposase [Planctomycetota bacterium]